MKDNVKFVLMMAGAVACRLTCSYRIQTWYFNRVILRMFPGGTGISVGEE